MTAQYWTFLRAPHKHLTIAAFIIKQSMQRMPQTNEHYENKIIMSPKRFNCFGSNGWNYPPLDLNIANTDILIKLHQYSATKWRRLEWKQELSKIWPSDLLLNQTRPIFELGLNIVKTNVRTKFHKNRITNVVFRVLYQMLTDDGRRRTTTDHNCSPWALHAQVS